MLDFEGEFVDLKVLDEASELLFFSQRDQTLDFVLNGNKVLLIKLDLILLRRKETKPSLFILFLQPRLLLFFLDQFNDRVLAPLHE